jgi:hypothetical protein
MASFTTTRVNAYEPSTWRLMTAHVHPADAQSQHVFEEHLFAAWNPRNLLSGRYAISVLDVGAARAANVSKIVEGLFVSSLLQLPLISC